MTNNDNRTQDLMAQLHALFHPKSVAIVGVPRGMKSGKIFLIALRDQNFPGKIYPVHPTAEEIDGLKAFPNVTAIPGPVDLAIIMVPNRNALPVVKECAAKGIKGIVLFTAGFKETGTDEGKAKEDELLSIAKTSGMRIIGPNCMGFYSPKTGLSFFPDISREVGSVGLISHSGSLSNIIAKLGPTRGIFFSKAVSLGNECDLNSADFLEYLGNDPDTKLIGMYLEGVKNGPRFLNVLKEASKKKPVIVWKVGLTSEGCQAALSHTGALTGTREIWEGAISQGGGIPVVGIETWIDALAGFSHLHKDLGERIAIVSGPGGLAVSAAEACGNIGLKLAKLSRNTQSALGEFVPATGTSCSNPVDVGLSASIEPNIYKQAVRTVAADPEVDAVVIIGRGLDPASTKDFIDIMIKAHLELTKAVVLVGIPGATREISEELIKAGVPFFDSPERALLIYSQVMKYQTWRKKNVS